MKRRIVSMLLAVAICVTGVIQWDITSKAEGVSEDISLEELMSEDAIIGYADSQTWGVYYSEGYSIVNKISSTKVGAGGVTNAAVKCKVSVTAILERKNSSGSWERVTSWTQTNSSAYSAIVSKSYTVASGYYYRVRGHHYAGTDAASSFTNALWVN